MKNLLITIALLVSTNAMADGFVCQTLDGELNVKIFNQTKPELGTRNAAVMILSDSSVGYGSKTIAKLSAEATTLTSDGSSYTGVVDLRRVDSNRAGELIAGTKLGYIKHIHVDVDFSYNNPVSHGTQLRGWLKLNKRDGSVVRENLVCRRYLKAE